VKPPNIAALPLLLALTSTSDGISSSRQLLLACPSISLTATARSPTCEDCPGGWAHAYNTLQVVTYLAGPQTCASNGSGGKIDCADEGASCEIWVRLSSMEPGSYEKWTKECDGSPAGCLQNGFLYVYGSPVN